MKDAFIPFTRALRIFGILPDCIQERLQDVESERLGVLGHDQNVRASLFPHLMNEIGEIYCVRQVHKGAGLHPVAVPAANDEFAPSLCEFQHGVILLPGAHTAELESMKEHTVLGDQTVQGIDMHLFADAPQIPRRVIQDHKHIPVVMQHLQKIV